MERVIHHCKPRIRIFNFQNSISILFVRLSSSIPLVKFWKEKKKKEEEEKIGTFVHYSHAEASIIEAKYKATRLFHKSDDK